MRLFFIDKMEFFRVKLTIVVVTAIILACWLSEAEATFRKPPFNGSIFGKRGTVTAGNYFVDLVQCIFKFAAF